MKILVVGSGIAGLSTALLFREKGHSVDIVEKKTLAEEEGYYINLVGKCLTVLERLGVLTILIQQNKHIKSNTIMKHDGELVRKLNISDFSDPDKLGIFVTRFELHKALIEKALQTAPILYQTTIEAIEDKGPSTRVWFTNNSEENYDLVVGADGVHSQLRKLLALNVSAMQTGIQFLAFSLREPLDVPDGSYSLIDKDHTFILTNINKSVCSGLFFVRSQDDDPEVLKVSDIQRKFSHFGWYTSIILDHLDDADSLFMDNAIWITMPQWSAGHCVLVGDSAYAVSPLAAKGAALALLGSAALVDACENEENLDIAFATYKDVMSKTVEISQKNITQTANFLVPADQKTRDNGFLFTRYIPTFLMNFFAKGSIRELL